MNTKNMKTQQTILARSVKTLSASGLLLALGISTSAVAAEVTCAAATNINADSAVNCFTPNTPAKSAEVNANFERLLARIAVLEAKLAAVTYNASTRNLRITNANLQIVNGSGTTGGTPNSRGNLIIGYNKPSTIKVCSNGSGSTQATCTGTWGANQRQGSHNLVIGNRHNYTQFGGLVAGDSNAIVGVSASVSGGAGNIASGANSSVSGGNANFANGNYSSVSGGQANSANSVWSSISGGIFNKADGSYSSVSGGASNTASGNSSSVSGGQSGTASGQWSSVIGSQGETAGNAHQIRP